MKQVYDAAHPRADVSTIPHPASQNQMPSQAYSKAI
jgi:hypothetical protein